MTHEDRFKTAIDAGLAFTQMTRQFAEAIAKDLVRTGEINRDQAAAQVDEFVERSKKSAELIIGLIRKEIDQRLAGLATRDDLAKLATLIKAAPKRTAATKTANKTNAKAAPKKMAAKKTAAKKTAAKKTAAKKTAAKKA